MNEKRHGIKKCFTTKAGGSLMVRLLSSVLSMTLTCAMLFDPALAQDPCAEIGPDCRALSSAEVKAFKELVLAVKDLLPVPDTARYAPDGAIEASNMPFVAETKISGAAIVGGSWPTGCFPFSPYNTLHFGYDAKATQGKPVDKDKNPMAAVQAMMSVMQKKIELSVWLRPHPYLVSVEDGKTVDVRDQDAYNIEKSAEFLSWQTGEDNVTLNMVFGPRTVNEAETLNTEKPAPKFAPLKSIELVIGGPKDEVAALKKRIDRRAFAGLLGSVVK
jgi:hypothetical protein